MWGICLKVGHLEDEPEPIIELCDEASCRETLEKGIALFLKSNKGIVLVSKLEKAFEDKGDALFQTLENMVMNNVIKVKYSQYEQL